jgi:cytochrome c-type biogenesis protein CcmE
MQVMRWYWFVLRLWFWLYFMCKIGSGMHWNATHKKRLGRIAVNLFLAVSGLTALLYSLQSNLHAYVTPKQLLTDSMSCKNKVCRMGGWVKSNSVQWIKENKLYVQFVAEQNLDSKDAIAVRFSGALPNLFQEGKMMLAEGRYINGVFHAQRIFAKHDENYQPRMD